MDDVVEGLERLHSLRESGSITEAEFNLAKARFLEQDSRASKRTRDVSPLKPRGPLKSRKLAVATIAVTLMALIGAVTFFWYSRPTEKVPAALAGKSWATNCAKGLQEQWGDGYQVFVLNGKEVSSTPVTYARTIGGLWVNQPEHSTFYEFDGDQIRPTHAVFDGIGIRLAAEWAHPCEAELISPVLTKVESSGNTSESGLYFAIGAGDADAVQKFIERIGDISSLSKLNEINGLASASTAEIYRMVQRGQGISVPVDVEAPWADAGQRWREQREYPGWLTGTFTSTGCSSSQIEYAKGTTTSTLFNEVIARATAKTIFVSGNRALIRWADGSRTIHARTPSGMATIGAMMKSGAPTPGRKRVEFQRCSPQPVFVDGGERAAPTDDSGGAIRNQNVHATQERRMIAARPIPAKAVLSPDSRQKAWVEIDGTDGGASSLWLAEISGGGKKRILAPHHSDDPKKNLTSFQGPVFSLDGGYIYVSAEAWATSDAVHQVNLNTGNTRFVIDGSILSILRNGPYRGYLIVSRHMYREGQQGGSYNPVYVVRPDGKETFMIPGSDNDYGERVLQTWLASKGWVAS